MDRSELHRTCQTLSGFGPLTRWGGRTLTLVEALPVAGSPQRAAPSDRFEAAYEVRLARAVHLRVARGFDPSELRQLLDALAALAE